MPDRLRHDTLANAALFSWAVGIEDTFIVDPWPETGRTLDEYALTQHDVRRDEDLALLASLGVPSARYGIPWYRVNPGPERWDWEWADRPLERLLELGVDPIVDLVHYGVPDWIEGAYLHPDFPARMAEYAARVADRYRGRIHLYTPLNEPRITASQCGYYGWWPPYCKGWDGFTRVILPVCQGISAACEAIRAVDPAIVLVHVEPTDYYVAATAGLAAEATLWQSIGFLALDLISGKMGVDHPLFPWLRAHGASEEALMQFEGSAMDLDVIGINMYPMFSNRVVVEPVEAGEPPRVEGSPALLEQLVELYWSRYHRPMMITETAADGSIARRREWLDGSVAAVRRLRERSVPVIGYTWWPMFDMVAWEYRLGTAPVTEYLARMGLWALDPQPGGGLARRHTPLVDAYRDYVAGGNQPVGLLAESQSERA